MAASALLKLKGQGHSDNLQSPAWPFISLLNSLPKPLDGLVWEPACGKGNVVNLLQNMNIKCCGTDIEGGIDFLQPWRVGDGPQDTIPYFDYIITNPPFSLKNEFLARCYEYKKPFALLLPITVFDDKERRAMFKEHGMQLVALPKRVDFEFPGGVYKEKPHFYCSFVTWGFNFPSDITYAD